jgi:hypothetical protein
MNPESPEWYALKWILDALNQAITEDMRTLKEFSSSTIPEDQAAVPFWISVLEEDSKMRDLLLQHYNITLEEIYIDEKIVYIDIDLDEMKRIGLS